jgi:hypothetical protein
MGAILSRTILTREGHGSLKLEAQQIKEFGGSYDEWQKWKSRTICAFDGSGYERVLSERDYATRNPKMNKVVFSQLSVSTVDGTAHHLIKVHEGLKDGHAAWIALCEWYDGDAMKNETSESLRTKLETLRLHSGLTASQYVNKFLMWFRELECIPGEGYSKSHGVYLFLKNIVDTDYAPTVVFLRNNSATLEECVVALRKSERDLAGKRTERRRLKQVIRRMKHQDESESDGNESEDEPPRKKFKRARRLTGEIQTTPKGFLHFPHEDWKELTSEEQKLIQSFNAKTKHGESVDKLQWPSGVTIVSKARRIEKSDVDSASSPKPKKKSKKKISFNIENGADGESDDDQ